MLYANNQQRSDQITVFLFLLLSDDRYDLAKALAPQCIQIHQQPQHVFIIPFTYAQKLLQVELPPIALTPLDSKKKEMNHCPYDSPHPDEDEPLPVPDTGHDYDSSCLISSSYYENGEYFEIGTLPGPATPRITLTYGGE